MVIFTHCLLLFTEEEISAMRQELDKYGIQMPTFSKIGGILANELSQDDAALHAAIIAINEAIETQNSTDIMTALGNPSANLLGISGDLSGDYSKHLYEAKQTKTENAKNKVWIFLAFLFLIIHLPVGHFINNPRWTNCT